MLLHGILSSYGLWDSLIIEMDEQSNGDIIKKSKEVSWEETRVYDNSNRGQKIAIYKERWR